MRSLVSPPRWAPARAVRELFPPLSHHPRLHDPKDGFRLVAPTVGDGAHEQGILLGIDEVRACCMPFSW